MVEWNIKDLPVMCQTCPYRDLEINNAIVTKAFNERDRYIFNVECCHKSICDYVSNYVTNNMNKNQEE